MTTHTLVLTQSYEPLKVVSWQRAITLLTLGKVEVVEEYDHEIRSTHLVFKCPAVIRLLGAFKRHKKPVKFSRVNIFARDHYKCQYCGTKGRLADLTYDHVTPKSQGGKTVWNNIVTSCYDCNARKRDRTPEQAGMKLLSRPVQPRWVPAMTLRISQDHTPSAWATWLYWTSQING
jgi:5-methylcytosine-specific restriction endonuclease McrA